MAVGTTQMNEWAKLGASLRLVEPRTRAGGDPSSVSRSQQAIRSESARVGDEPTAPIVSRREARDERGHAEVLGEAEGGGTIH